MRLSRSLKSCFGRKIVSQFTHDNIKDYRFWFELLEVDAKTWSFERLYERLLSGDGNHFYKVIDDNNVSDVDNMILFLCKFGVDGFTQHDLSELLLVSLLDRFAGDDKYNVLQMRQVFSRPLNNVAQRFFDDFHVYVRDNHFAETLGLIQNKVIQKVV